MHRFLVWFQQTSKLRICWRHVEYSGVSYSSLYIPLGHDLNIAIPVQKGKGLPGLAMQIYLQHSWLHSYLTLCVSSLAILQSLQYRSMLGTEKKKKSAELGCSVKTTTSKGGLSFKLTFATLVRTQNASLQQSGRQLHRHLLT